MNLDELLASRENQLRGLIEQINALENQKQLSMQEMWRVEGEIRMLKTLKSIPDAIAPAEVKPLDVSKEKDK